MKLSAIDLDLKLRHTFTIARSSMDCAENVLVRIRHGKRIGLGEAAPSDYYGQTRATCRRALERMGRQLEKASPFDLENVLNRLSGRFPQEASARAAIDIALHDLIGQHVGLPLWKYWGLDPNATPQTSFTIGIASLETVCRKVEEARSFPILKIKLGVQGDMDILREVRRLCPKKGLRVDANCGWTVRETIAKAKVLESLGVEFLEQPIPPGNPLALKRIRERIGVPLMTDESSVRPEDIPRLYGCVDGINIKLVKCGGLRNALKMIHLARAGGLKIMVGCMVESSISITAAAHLTPLVDYADLDGALLILNDPFHGMRIDRQARIILPTGPGLGVKSNPAPRG